MNATVTAIANSGMISILFIVIATFLSVAMGWLVKVGKLPLREMMAFGDRQWQFLRIWVKVALGIGAIVPLILLIILWNEPNIRQFLLVYLVVLIIQLASETSLSRLLVPSVVVPIGTLYTIYRIWQLWEGLQIADYHQPWLGLLWLVLLFWIANIIMLLFMAIPSLMPKIASGNLS
ncbi:MAG TPA: hypothetical protein IGS17_11825 [Oscillatoriales cyanobacterium M59_W2019_021]|nr:MAG: hypothetical protein D6728_04905 [Cyanobacteria bacterium J055]HIK33822.1 hypothetical protein [Oscillatoriales cyanobacterium M4454_W2019_049]HIK51592.1 hypothetical protein [Oscillatoriales cyanobacterium M59_W2019_021]